MTKRENAFQQKGRETSKEKKDRLNDEKNQALMDDLARIEQEQEQYEIDQAVKARKAKKTGGEQPFYRQGLNENSDDDEDE